MISISEGRVLTARSLTHGLKLAAGEKMVHGKIEFFCFFDAYNCTTWIWNIFSIYIYDSIQVCIYIYIYKYRYMYICIAYIYIHKYIKFHMYRHMEMSEFQWLVMFGHGWLLMASWLMEVITMLQSGVSNIYIYNTYIYIYIIYYNNYYNCQVLTFCT